MEMDEFKNAVQTSYANYFNNAACLLSQSFNKPYTLHVNCLLQKLDGRSITEVQDDLMELVHFVVCPFGGGNMDADLPNEMVLRAVLRYRIKGEFVRCLPHINMVGSAEDLLQHFDEAFSQLHDSIINDLAEDLIPEEYWPMLNCII